MSKALVDRELLDRVLNPETGEEWSKACRELRNVLAQPAEADTCCEDNYDSVEDAIEDIKRLCDDNLEDVRKQ